MARVPADRSPSTSNAHRFDLTLGKEILWESDTVTDADVRAMEVKLIREARANDLAVGYNLTPRWLGDHAGEL
jgi:hypothetical protein